MSDVAVAVGGGCCDDDVAVAVAAADAVAPLKRLQRPPCVHDAHGRARGRGCVSCQPSHCEPIQDGIVVVAVVLMMMPPLMPADDATHGHGGHGHDVSGRGDAHDDGGCDGSAETSFPTVVAPRACATNVAHPVPEHVAVPSAMPSHADDLP